jgi:Flp pilus assembly protein TadG
MIKMEVAADEYKAVLDLQFWKAQSLAFSENNRGNVAVIFALASIMIIIGVGSAMDLTRAYMARQKPVQTATLACQYASRPSISRPFLLDRGYYQVNYDYISDMLFSGASTFCMAVPSASASSIYNTWGNGTASATNRISGYSPTSSYNTNFVGVFVANGQLVSTPNTSSTQEYQTTYTNPDGTTASSYWTATAPLDYVNLANYSATQSNPLIDFCAYDTTWQTRTPYIEITKPGYYWLTLSAMGQVDKMGDAIDDVKLTALGSLYMSSPPSNPVTIPVPNPQPGAATYFTGFEVISDPLTSPAALQ